MAIKSEYLKKNKVNDLDQLRYQNYSNRKRNRTTELFEMIAIGFGGEGTRNDTLAKFTGGLLSRHVEAEFVLQLAQIANNNSLDPLPDKELERTVMSMINKDMRR